MDTPYIKLAINHYMTDNFYPSRQLFFQITKDCLLRILKETQDERTISQFLESYDSDEAEVIYDYASDKGEIISEEIVYSDDFLQKYKDFVHLAKSLDPDITDDRIADKEEYYWIAYGSD